MPISYNKMVNFIIITIFPDLVEQVFKYGIVRRAVSAGSISYRLVNPRDYATDKHRSVDDVAYGGRPGMVMKPEPIFSAYDALSVEGALLNNRRFIHMTPRGRLLNHELAKELSTCDQLILLSGRYEGIDERVISTLVDMEISIGDYVLSGGELPAMVLIDAVARLIRGVVGYERSVVEDSFVNYLLDHPHYTRPAEYRGMKVPQILLTGNHEEIAKWRRLKAEEITKERRPDLWEKYLKRFKGLLKDASQDEAENAHEPDR